MEKEHKELRAEHRARKYSSSKIVFYLYFYRGSSPFHPFHICSTFIGFKAVILD